VIERVDLFSMIHKGIRGALFELAAEAARLEVSSTEAIDRLAAKVERVLGYLDEHAAHEDDHTLVAVRELDPRLAEELSDEHRALELAQADVARAADALALLDLAGRAAAAARLVRAINHLIAMQLLHMNREETEVNRVLWAGLDDTTLAEIRTRLVSTIPAPRYAEWLELVRVATNPVERERAGGARVG
jgi:hypothetical protein